MERARRTVLSIKNWFYLSTRILQNVMLCVLDDYATLRPYQEIIDK